MLCKDGGLNEKLGVYTKKTGWKQFDLELFDNFPAVVFKTCQHSKCPQVRLLLFSQVILMLVLLSFRHQTGWLYLGISSRIDETVRDKWVLVTTTWRVFRLRMEERPPL